ncbi:MAG: 50S ribosomal protein L23 [Planctomycetes bacterium]|nr:50S ribosomal protein L23 [Planctomycetota bacterium]
MATKVKQAAPAPELSSLLAPHQVIVRPLLTEKGMHRSTRHNAYSFEVNPLATKHDIRHAVEELFHVKVLKVHTVNRKGKPRRIKNRASHTADWKKAIVKLHSDSRIDFF